MSKKSPYYETKVKFAKCVFGPCDGEKHPYSNNQREKDYLFATPANLVGQSDKYTGEVISSVYEYRLLDVTVKTTVFTPKTLPEELKTVDAILHALLHPKSIERIPSWSSLINRLKGQSEIIGIGYAARIARAIDVSQPTVCNWLTSGPGDSNYSGRGTSWEIGRYLLRILNKIDKELTKSETLTIQALRVKRFLDREKNGGHKKPCKGRYSKAAKCKRKEILSNYKELTMQTKR